MRLFRSLFAVALMTLPVAAQAGGPQPPCGAAVTPAFAPPGRAPAIAIFHATDLAQSNWQAPACTGWSAASRSKLLIALSGSFHFSGSIDQIAMRLAAISTLSKVQYWSTTDKEWRPLALDSYALSGPNAASRRPDFSPAELSKDASLYYWENDSRSGEIVTHLSVLEHTPDRMVVSTENVTPVRRFLITIFPPGTLQSALFVQHVAPGVWGVFLMSRTLEGSSILSGVHDASYVNRAAALYRKIAGIRTDEEPPAAP